MNHQICLDGYMSMRTCRVGPGLNLVYYNWSKRCAARLVHTPSEMTASGSVSSLTDIRESIFLPGTSICTYYVHDTLSFSCILDPVGRATYITVLQPKPAMYALRSAKGGDVMSGNARAGGNDGSGSGSNRSFYSYFYSHPNTFKLDCETNPLEQDSFGPTIFPTSSLVAER
jgi:hypothetical protein